MRSVFNAVPQAKTWSSMMFTNFSCVGAVVIAGVALRVYEAFPGGHPILDTIYDVRLRCEDIDRLDARHSGTPGGPNSLSP